MRAHEFHECVFFFGKKRLMILSNPTWISIINNVKDAPRTLGYFCFWVPFGVVCYYGKFCSKPHPAGWHCRDRVGEDLGLFVASHCAHQCPGLNKNLPRATYKTILGGCWISTTTVPGNLIFTGAPGFRFIAKRRWVMPQGTWKNCGFERPQFGISPGDSSATSDIWGWSNRLLWELGTTLPTSWDSTVNRP